MDIVLEITTCSLRFEGRCVSFETPEAPAVEGPTPTRSVPHGSSSEESGPATPSPGASACGAPLSPELCSCHVSLLPALLAPQSPTVALLPTWKLSAGRPDSVSSAQGRPQCPAAEGTHLHLLSGACVQCVPSPGQVTASRASSEHAAREPQAGPSPLTSGTQAPVGLRPRPCPPPPAPLFSRSSRASHASC